MANKIQILIGRSKDCDLVVDDPTVSSRHARLVAQDGQFVIEDLGSANGTYVAGVRVEKARVKVGDDVSLGRASLPWGSRVMRRLIRGTGGDTAELRAVSHRRFVCGACGAEGRMPTLFHQGELRCGACGRILLFGEATKKKRRRSGLAAALGTLLLFAAAGGGLWYGLGRERIHEAAERVRMRVTDGAGEYGAATSAVEASIRAHSVARVVEAIEPGEELTRNTAVRLASGDGDGGAFNVSQVARLWSEVRKKWTYVNDPRGSEYFARSSETIANGYAGDCDDFAIALVSMLEAIGGRARLVMMNGPQGGHAYAEVCIESDGAEVRTELVRFYRSRSVRRRFDLPRTYRVPNPANHRADASCPTWLNLDWNAGMPGGVYEVEQWAVAIYPDGVTETLTQGGVPGQSSSRPEEL